MTFEGARKEFMSDKRRTPTSVMGFDAGWKARDAEVAELLGLARGYKQYLLKCTDVTCAQESELLAVIEAVIAKVEGRA